MIKKTHNIGKIGLVSYEVLKRRTFAKFCLVFGYYFVSLGQIFNLLR